jgi:hypothetical protein
LTTGPNVAPGEKPPALAPIAREHSSVSAIEFAVYYIKALDWSQATTDPYLLEQISAPGCSSCQASIHSLEKLRSEGGYLRSGRTKLDSSRLVDGKSDVKADYIIKFELTQEPVVVVRPTATTTEVPRSTTITSYVYVSWVHGRWLIIEREGVR